MAIAVTKRMATEHPFNFYAGNDLRSELIGAAPVTIATRAPACGQRASAWIVPSVISTPTSRRSWMISGRRLHATAGLEPIRRNNQAYAW